MAATAEVTAKSTPAPKAATSASARWFDQPVNRYLAIGGAVVAIAILAWFIVLSGRRKEDFASRALEQARGIAESGNLPLAASELQKVITTYGGTRAGQEAVMSLNQVRLVNGQYELAAAALEEFLKGNPSSEFRAPAYGLLGRALENAKRPQEAAQAYTTGSAAAVVPYLRTELLLDAGRAWVSAHDTTKALAAYRQIIKDFPDSPSQTEATVRLSELTAGQP
ncbi:MAG: tetratricopeptide repeat protein [Gemmatimonadetes bacterium]|nr:tetratricopeptide repeat protein [Gemmatimonadota bacterium]MBK7783330.1 tetratricopeptide repeat protein [Gemmatimonadota bacterium]MBK9068620.1 tetratricopeptide repeat protein [Gemmatimonadota bacterium]